MVMNKIKSVFILVLFQFVITNVFLFGELYLYFTLPRYLNILFGLFAVPILFLIASIYIFKEKLKLLNYDLSMALSVTLITIWIPVTFSIGFNTVSDYFYLIKSNKLTTTSIDNFKSNEWNGYLKINNYKILNNQFGLSEIYSRGSKNSPAHTNYYYTIPVVSKDWKIETPISLFIFDSTDPIFKGSIDSKDLLSDKAQPEYIEGIPVIDSFDIRKANNSLEKAVQKYGLKVSPDVKFIQLRDSFEKTMEEGKFHFQIFISIVYLIFIFIPAILYFIYSTPKVKSES
jgi:hypothetical protein